MNKDIYFGFFKSLWRKKMRENESKQKKNMGKLQAILS